MDGATWALVTLVFGWALVAVGVACICYVAYCSYRNGRQLAQGWSKLKKMQRKEWLARLRHRDFEAFCIEVNNQRAEKKQPPIPVELLQKVRYNLMYTIDED